MYKRKRAGNTITRKINSTKDTAAKADKNHYISLVEGIPQAPFERRISFCGCAFCERFLAAPLVSSAVFRNSNIKCHRKFAFVRMRACLRVSFASIKAPLCMESVIRQKLTKHRENRSPYIQCYYSITFLLPYCYFNYAGNLQIMGQTMEFILFV